MQQFTIKYHRLQHSELIQQRTGQYEEYEDGLFKD